RSKGKSVAHLNRHATWSLRDTATGAVTEIVASTLGESVGDKHGRLQRELQQGMIQAFTVRRVVGGSQGAPVLEVEAHAFSGLAEGRCTCGKTTSVRRDWEERFEAAPGSWSEHEVFQRV